MSKDIKYPEEIKSEFLKRAVTASETFYRCENLPQGVICKMQAEKPEAPDKKE